MTWTKIAPHLLDDSIRKEAYSSPNAVLKIPQSEHVLKYCPGKGYFIYNPFENVNSRLGG